MNDNAPEEERDSNRKMLGKLVVVAVMMFGFGLSQVYFLFFVVLPTIRGGQKAGDKPWEGAEGLEWTVPSPAPFHTFETPPLVK